MLSCQLMLIDNIFGGSKKNVIIHIIWNQKRKHKHPYSLFQNVALFKSNRLKYLRDYQKCLPLVIAVRQRRNLMIDWAFVAKSHHTGSTALLGSFKENHFFLHCSFFSNRCAFSWSIIIFHRDPRSSLVASPNSH